MDVKNAFLHGNLKEEVYMRIPQGITSPSKTSAYRLHRSLYGLKQAPRAWFEKFKTTMCHLKFAQSSYDPSLFLRHTSTSIIVLLVYVDDIIIMGIDAEMIKTLQASLSNSFHIKDLGPLHYFLGLEIQQNSNGLFINRHKYTVDLIDLADLQSSSPVDTPLQIDLKLSKDDGTLLPDPHMYRRLVGSLVYLTIARPDISYAMNLVSQFMSAPKHLHLTAVK
eukprot:TRINITY_DN9713_c0_g2_i1.p1 TRINITY_DN9713_c0_g2~~TRINITY_DN9713_c0_g2_i1.p1  ORF type:complete len:230 (+),score=29.01 TRINITY_DN9713_c0_g2_i1:27-692(+)